MNHHDTNSCHCVADFDHDHDGVPSLPVWLGLFTKSLHAHLYYRREESKYQVLFSGTIDAANPFHILLTNLSQNIAGALAKKPRKSSLLGVGCTLSSYELLLIIFIPSLWVRWVIIEYANCLERQILTMVFIFIPVHGCQQEQNISEQVRRAQQELQSSLLGNTAPSTISCAPSMTLGINHEQYHPLL